MEKANKAQGCGCIILPNGIGGVVWLDEEGHRVVGPASKASFRMCKRIQTEMAKNDLIIQDQGRCMLNPNQVKIEGTQEVSQVAENTQQIHAEKVQSK